MARFTGMMRKIVRGVSQRFRRLRDYRRLPASARNEACLDRTGPPPEDPGSSRIIDEAIAWLGQAQDHSESQDDGVARHYSLLTGWSGSYPETTGYIIPTLLAYARLRGDAAVRERARRMLDWLVAIQLPGGGFPGGVIGSQPVVPVTFNTGQIVLGLAAGVREWGEPYREVMCRAADWLRDSQCADGCWRAHPSPFTAPGEKSYETHVSWGLLEAARVAPNRGYDDAALANVRWALRQQIGNGWFGSCCLEQPDQPLTHTIGYVLRGVLEAYRFTNDATLLHSAQRAAEGLLGTLRSDGFLPGRLDAYWRGTVNWGCLTGNAQLAYCWFMLYEYTGNESYRLAAMAANRFVRRTVRLDGPLEVRGAVKGSFPVDGGYNPYQYLNWAVKFCVDANLYEEAVVRGRTRRDCVGQREPAFTVFH